MLSVVIITKNEADNIRDCLTSVEWADEIVVLDSGSADDTVKICREFTNKVFATDWPGFGPQKNRGVERATGDWILSIDADERVSPELRAEIEQVLETTKHNGFEIPRSSFYCGKRIRHSGWWPDYIVRLFRRGFGKFNDVLVHEKVEVTGSMGRLRNPLIHHSFDNFEQVLNKLNHYSTSNAEMLFQAGRKPSLLQAASRGLWTFFRTYILRAGFLDGRQGFMLAVSNAEGTYYKYVKLIDLHRTRSRTEKK